jgi:hypothetical protein
MSAQNARSLPQENYRDRRRPLSCPLSNFRAVSRGTGRQANHELDYLLNELRRCRGRRELTKTRIASSRALLRDNPSPFAAASNSRKSVPSTTGPILWLAMRSLGRPRGLIGGTSWIPFCSQPQISDIRNSCQPPRSSVLDGNGKSHPRSYSLHRSATLYRALAGNDNFCDGGFEAVRVQVQVH